MGRGCKRQHQGGVGQEGRGLQRPGGARSTKSNRGPTCACWPVPPGPGSRRVPAEHGWTARAQAQLPARRRRARPPARPPTAAPGRCAGQPPPCTRRSCAPRCWSTCARALWPARTASRRPADSGGRRGAAAGGQFPARQAPSSCSLAMRTLQLSHARPPPAFRLPARHLPAPTSRPPHPASKSPQPRTCPQRQTTRLQPPAFSTGLVHLGQGLVLAFSQEAVSVPSRMRRFHSASLAQTWARGESREQLST